MGLSSSGGDWPWYGDACGFTLAATSPIAGLRGRVSNGSPDLTVEFLDAPPSPVAPPEAPWYVSPYCDEHGAPLLVAERMADGAHRLHYSEGAVFDVDARGSAVAVSWQAPLTQADAATFLLGPVLGFVMRLRGVVPLHASGVAIDGRGVLFVGDAGAGKSTTAAAFAGLGYPVLSDDIVPVADRRGAPAALPGYPRVSVWADSAAAVIGASSLPAFSGTYTKQYLDLIEHGYRFQDTPVTIDTIFLMRTRHTSGHGPRLRDLSPREALIGLVSNTYCGYLLDAPMRAREFDILSALVARVPVRELAFGDALEDVAQSCDAVAQAVRAHAGVGASHV